jgi:hypothetical protein
MRGCSDRNDGREARFFEPRGMASIDEHLEIMFGLARRTGAVESEVV